MESGGADGRAGTPTTATIGADERIELLAHVPAFAVLPKDTLLSIAHRMEVETFQAGQDVACEGEEGDRLYLIAQGTAEVTTFTHHQRVVLTSIERGDLFGELAVFTATRQRQATVTATSLLVTLTLTAEAFQDLLRRHPDVRQVFEASAQNMLGEKFVTVQSLYRLHFTNPRRERLFLASMSFFVTFAFVRYVTHQIRIGRGPFRNVTTGGRHIHHLVWGILCILAVGYLWLIQVGTGLGDSRKWARSTACVYGVGSALTLDEFALWLNLADVYWGPEGRVSVDAVILFGSVLSTGLLGGSFFRALLRFLAPRDILHTPFVKHR